MTLGDIKKASLSLIEEINDSGTTEDPDILAKLPYVINQIQIELSQIKRIGAKKAYTVTDETLEQDLPTDFYQIDKVNGDCFIYANKIVFKEAGTYNMYYFKYPTIINKDTPDTQAMEISEDCLNAMPYGVASDLLKTDPSVDYSIYASRYNELKSQLRLSNSSPMMFVNTSEVVS